MASQPPSSPSCGDDGSYFDLGSYHRPATTSSKEALTWFNRGLVWSYAFNHEEAVACFEKAVSLDGCFAMAYWGVAYALGPNYNKPWEFFDKYEMIETVEKTNHATRKAAEYASNATAAEIALIEALQYRYPSDHPPTENKNNRPNWAIWNHQYADAMRKAYQAHPTDHDVAALFVDALMNLTPWNLWDIRTGEPAPGAFTLEAKQVLETAFAQPGGDQHPSLLHLWIHLMEMSQHPEEALPMANNLRNLVPDAGHLRHMPSHLDVLCGHYADGVIANSAAIRADEKYVERGGRSSTFYTLYRCHDYHFRIYSALFSAQSRIAIETAAQLEACLSESLLRTKSPPMASWLEGFRPMRLHVYVRFGKWIDILNVPFPTDRDLYCATTATLHYARGLAFAALSRVDEADDARSKFRDALTRVPKSRTVFNNTVLDVLGVASAMLDGEIAYRRAEYETAFGHLRRSVELYDNLPYDEPWGFMQPTRHALAALLLEQGHFEEALQVYRADLGINAKALPRAHQHPNNVWALHGYHECLMKLGRAEEAKKVEPALKKALEVADVPIKSSCFCRLRL